MSLDVLGRVAWDYAPHFTPRAHMGYGPFPSAQEKRFSNANCRLSAGILLKKWGRFHDESFNLPTSSVALEQRPVSPNAPSIQLPFICLGVTDTGLRFPTGPIASGQMFKIAAFP